MGWRCYVRYIRVMMTTVTHRDLRNRSGEVLRDVEAGEAFTVTNRGRPVAQLVPLTETVPDLPLHRPAATRGGFTQLRRHVLESPAAETLDDLRGDR